MASYDTVIFAGIYKGRVEYKLLLAPGFVYDLETEPAQRKADAAKVPEEKGDDED